MSNAVMTDNPISLRKQSETLKSHVQKACDAVTDIMRIRDTGLSAATFDAPPGCMPAVDEMVKEYQQQTGSDAAETTHYESYVIVFFPGLSRIAKRNHSLLLHLCTMGDPSMRAKELEGKVARIDLSGDHYLDVSKTCGIEVAGSGKIGFLCVVFPSTTVPNPNGI